MILGTTLVACSQNKGGVRKFQSLKTNQTLFVNGVSYYNYEVKEEVIYVDKIEAREYKLQRVASEFNVPSEVKAFKGVRDNYYYYFTKYDTTEEMMIGRKTTVKKYIHEYLIIKEHENIAIKTTYSNKVDYIFESGSNIYENKFRKDFDYNGYFTYESELLEVVPLMKEHLKELRNEVKVTYIKKDKPEYIYSSIPNHDTFYYFDKI